MSNKKDKLQGFDILVSTFVLLSKESKEEVLDKMVQVKSTHYYKGQLVLDIEYDAYWSSCWFHYYKLILSMMHIGLHVGLIPLQVLENTLVLIYQKCMKILSLNILISN